MPLRSANRSALPREVWLFGWVSFATDAATEAVYPLLPFFLTHVLGAGAMSLGLIEGAAEATNSFLKILSGRAADRTRSKRRLVIIGYAISSAMRPLIAAAQTWTQVFAVRLFDRVGKGIRGAPRDAMLAGFATPATRGRIYGFHRAMDHSGAVAGPILATLFLLAYPGEYRTLFALTIVPGAIAVALLWFVKEDADSTRTRPAAAESGIRQAAGSHSSAQEPLPPAFRSFIVVMTIFTLGNSTDAFLLLALTEAAGSAAYIPLMWSALHVVKAGTSMIGGSWSDRIGRRKVIAAGWLTYAAVYTGFALTSSLAALLPLFLIYGLFFGLTEGTEKALVADLAPASRRGFAFGVFTAVQGLGALAASLVFGVISTAAGPAAAFGVGAALALTATVLLMTSVRLRPTP